MQRHLIDYIRRPDYLDLQAMAQLRELVEKYPYFHAARILLLRALYQLHDPSFDSELKKSSRIVMLNGSMRIDDELEIFAGIVSNRPVPSANGTLKIKTGTGFVQDDFRHEQCLVITVGEKRILLSGCAHHGILNILDEFRSIYETEPDVVISGFHLKKKTAYTADDIREIRGIARELKSFRSVFYTCHCTGEEAFAVMKEVMGDRLHYLHCGDVLEF